MSAPDLYLAWKDSPAWRGFRTGVSLHSHTSHSRETLDFIPRYASLVPGLRRAVARSEERYRAAHGRDLDYFDTWWTPPLGPREALDLERSQITAGLGLHALVSITDHDSIDAPLLLRSLSGAANTPVSLEWTVPYRETIFHLGVHHLPPRRARERVASLYEFTANPSLEALAGLLDWLAEDEQTLLVFNHPYWDEKGRGQARHDECAEEFVRLYRRWVHAIELNGLRPWSENRRAAALARRSGLPIISGGDRHTCEPNAMLNLTNARTFAEFVEEVRIAGLSRVLFMPQYRDPLALRILRGVADVLRHNEQHAEGWQRWTDRVFHRGPDGLAQPLSAYWRQREPGLVRHFVGLVRMAESRHVAGALRWILAPAQEIA